MVVWISVAGGSSAAQKSGDYGEWSGQINATLAPEGKIEAGDEIMDEYAEMDGWDSGVDFADGGPKNVFLTMPSPFERESSVGDSILPPTPA